MEIIVEQKKINLDNRILSELENFHKNSDSIYNENNESYKSAFNIISVNDDDDIIKTHELLTQLDIEVISNMETFLMTDKSKQVKKGFVIRDGSGWRIQSHYLGWGMNVEDLEKCVNYITEKGVVNDTKDYTKYKILSRIKELKTGKKAYDINEKILPNDEKMKASYSEEGHNFWKSSNIIISELEKYV